MWKDPIVEELHTIREEIAKEHDYDLHKLVQSLRERQKQYKGRIVSRDRKRKGFEQALSKVPDVEPEEHDRL